MSLEKTGRTLLFALFVVMLVAGAGMAVKVSVPYIRKVSPSLADTLQAI